jgi:hypothetical protein
MEYRMLNYFAKMTFLSLLFPQDVISSFPRSLCQNARLPSPCCQIVNFTLQMLLLPTPHPIAKLPLPNHQLYIGKLLFRSTFQHLQFYKWTFFHVDKCELSSFQFDTWQVHMHIVTYTLACFQVHITHCHMHVAKFLGAHRHAFKCTLCIATCTLPRF